jgi:hypothetical protein
VTNGSVLLEGIDGRSAKARRYRDLVGELVSEHGGALSTPERALIRQAAALMLRAEELQAAIVRGEPVDEDKLIRLSSEARRVLSRLKRPPQPAPFDGVLTLIERPAFEPSAPVERAQASPGMTGGRERK